MPLPSEAPQDPGQILANLRSDIGTATPWRQFRVTEADAARFRAAVDPTTRDSGPPAPIGEPPPTFFSPDPIILAQRLGWERHHPYPNTLDGGTRWEWLAPIRVGDTVQLRSEVTDVTQKMGSEATGRMFLTTVLVTCASPAGEVIARCWGTSISYQGSGA